MIKKLAIAFSLIALLSACCFAVNPTGTVFLYLDDTDHPIFNAHMDGSTNQVVYAANTGAIPVGQHTLIAQYGGDGANFAPGQGQTVITIDNPFTAVTVTVAATPSETKAGQPMAVTITLTPQQ